MDERVRERGRKREREGRERARERRARVACMVYMVHRMDAAGMP